MNIKIIVNNYYVMKKTSLLYLLSSLFIVLLITLTYYDSSYYSSFDKADNTKDVYIIGKLVKNSTIIYNPSLDENFFSFYMQDKEHQISKIIFLGSKPNDFEYSDNIVVTGKMHDNVFYAKKILMKCPSKYSL
ncbi:MAG: cytochrome c maturation protein CcmE [Bacteroides sp.]|nr:MAG: cytochrome c maturation protein CcmE [Bacteroides sp.]